MNEYSGLFSFRVTGWISLQSKGLLRAFSSITVQNHQFLALSLLYSPALTSIRDYWKNHSFDNMDLCQQSNVSVFYYTGCFYISKYLWVQMCDFLSNLSVSFTSNFLLVLFKFCSSLIYFLSIWASKFLREILHPSQMIVFYQVLYFLSNFAIHFLLC